MVFLERIYDYQIPVTREYTEIILSSDFFELIEQKIGLVFSKEKQESLKKTLNGEDSPESRFFFFSEI